MTGIYEVEKKALSAKAIEKMRYGDKDKADIAENVGLRVSCVYITLKICHPFHLKIYHS